MGGVNLGIWSGFPKEDELVRIILVRSKPFKENIYQYLVKEMLCLCCLDMGMQCLDTRY